LGEEADKRPSIGVDSVGLSGDFRLSFASEAARRVWKASTE
jgi:hypothetical protein